MLPTSLKHILLWFYLMSLLFGKKSLAVEVRLVGGSNSNEGRVEVFVEGVWGRICDNLWDINDARVVCRQLGFPDTIDPPNSTRFGRGSGYFIYDAVECIGNENDITSCPSRTLRVSPYWCSDDASAICTTTSEVRLVNGSNINEGRVEVYEGEWGTICDDSWDINDARVVCRQLGFPDASDAPLLARFGRGVGDIMYDDVACTGAESDISSCPNNGLRSHDCNHGQDASVICTSKVRLVGGSNNKEGRVEVYVDGEWGTICGYWGWDINDARVVCRQQGYPVAIHAPREAYFGQGSGDVVHDNVYCTGSESDITSCPKSGLPSHNCQHGEDASVICTNVRLVNGNKNNEGRVEVYTEGEWGKICDDSWDISDARVVCRQLDFLDAIDAPQSARFGKGSGDIMYDDVACTGNENDITSCPNSGLRPHNCCHGEDASVICTSRVRLVGGSNNYEGRVEVFVEGKWGTICDDLWDLDDARVVCRQLGFSDAIDAPPEARFDQGSGDIIYDDVECTGIESDITSCPSRGIRSHNCHHGEDASVICTNVRLVNGSNNHEGRVEVYIEGKSGTICDDSWDINDARVVCRHLGFSDAIDAPLSARFGEGSGEIMYDDVACTGNENDITSCPNRGLQSHNCSHGQDASVICTTYVRLVNGSNNNEGRVEVFIEGEWGTICDDFWDIHDARVVCRQLDFPDAIAAPHLAHFGQGSGDIIYDDVKCTGNESDITSCSHIGPRSHNCRHYEDASVICSTS